MCLFGICYYKLIDRENVLGAAESSLWAKVCVLNLEIALNFLLDIAVLDRIAAYAYVERCAGRHIPCVLCIIKISRGVNVYQGIAKPCKCKMAFFGE